MSKKMLLGLAILSCSLAFGSARAEAKDFCQPRCGNQGGGLTLLLGGDDSRSCDRDRSCYQSFSCQSYCDQICSPCPPPCCDYRKVLCSPCGPKCLPICSPPCRPICPPPCCPPPCRPVCPPPCCPPPCCPPPCCPPPCHQAPCVPEPTSLFFAGLLGLGALRRKLF